MVSSTFNGSVDANSDAVDTVPANSTGVPAPISTTGGLADLVLTLTDPAPTAPGGTAEVVVEIDNTGPSDASTVYTLPAGVTTFDLPIGCTAPDEFGPVTCAVSRRAGFW